MANRPWPHPIVLAVGAMGLGVGWLTSKWLNGRSCQASLLLILYVVWPHRDLTFALQLLTLVVFVLGLRRVRSIRAPIRPPVDFFIFLFSFLIYLTTAAPDVLPADSGEFQVVAPLLGVAHPPGYPLYTLVGWLFTKLVPIGTAAYRLNLLSALLAASTLTLLGGATRHWARRLGAAPGAEAVGGVAAALALGTATTFWAQAGIANVRMPTVFFAALSFYALARHTADKASPQRGKTSDKWLWLLALALGLGFGHHPSLAFIGSFMALYLLLVDPRLALQPRRWGRPLLLVGLSLLPLLYLPLRGAADPPLAPPNLNTWEGFWFHVTAQGFEGDMFAFANAHDLPGRLTLLPMLFRFQFNPVLLMAAALGALVLAWRDRRLCALLVGGLVLHTFVSITYRAPQTVEYMMPAYLPLAILVGLAVPWLVPSKVKFRDVGVGLAAIVVLAGVINGLDHAPSFFALSRDDSTRAAMEPLLQHAPPDALILADWRWATSLWYLQWVEGQRPDVEVQYVYPVGGQAYEDTWREWVEASAGERPVLLTHAFEWPEYTLEPLGAGFAIHPRPYTALDGADLLPLDALFGAHSNGVRLLGYRLNRSEWQAGQLLELTLAWQAVGELTAPPSFSARVVGRDGQMFAQDDRYLGAGYAPGEIRFERFVLPLYPNLVPGDYALTVQVYSVGDAGFETWSLVDGAAELALATLPVQARHSTPVTLHPLHIPFSGGPTLVGVDYDRSFADTLRVYLYWRGPTTGEEQVHIGGASAPLPPLAQDTYHTAVLDLPGDTRGRLALKLTGAEGRVRTAAGAWGWSSRELHLPAPSSDARFVLLGEEAALVGVSPASDGSISPGDTLTLRPTFLALKGLTKDIRTSVRLWDGEGELRVRHDQQPALGAIPTLKWIRGSRVIDPHLLTVPADPSGGTVQATLVVYEYFRGMILKPLDERMDKVLLGGWAVKGP